MTYPICIECKHMARTGIGGIHSCNSPKREQKFDVIYGTMINQIACRDARAMIRDCGITGKFFEPLDKPEPPVVKSKKWYDRFIGKC